MYTQTTNDVEVSVKPFYVEERSNPELGFFFYAYQIRIVNHGVVTHQLLNRHWIIHDGNGHKEEVKGEGVVGRQPTLGPGESFEYTSACPLRTPTGNMRGSYDMVSSDGRRFKATIPVFFLRPPTLH